MSARRPANDSDASGNSKGARDIAAATPPTTGRDGGSSWRTSTLVEVALPTRSLPSEAVGPPNRPKAAVFTTAGGRGPFRISTRLMG
jgi:hypothetical protein